MSIQELRQKLQAPRKAMDTWYGKNIMRRFSIYLTQVFILLKLKPDHASLASFVFVILGFWAACHSLFGLAILCVNLWYLLDHVDGELARFYGAYTATGIYVDTIINFFVQPLTLAGLGIGLWLQEGNSLFVWLGAWGGFGYILQSVIPMLEDAIVLEKKLKDGVSRAPARVQERPPEEKPSFFRQLFIRWHFSITFPNLLTILSGAYAAGMFLSYFQRIQILKYLFIYYALSALLISALQLMHKILSKKPDQRLARIGE